VNGLGVRSGLGSTSVTHAYGSIVMMDAEHKPRARGRPKGAPTHVVKVPLRVSPRKAKTCLARFHAGARLYNACRAEALRRGERLRAGPAFDKAKGMPTGKERTETFKALDKAYGFAEAALQSYASSLRKSFVREQVFAQEAQEIGSRAFGAVQRWHFGQGGKPRPKSTRRGLRSMSGKDLNGALRPYLKDGKLVALQWGDGFLLPLERPKAGSSKRAKAERQERETLEELICAKKLLYCRIVRRQVKGRWCFEAQFVLDGPASQRHPVGEGVVSMDMGPSTVHYVADDSAGHEVLAPGVVFPAKRVRRLSRRLDRCHKGESPACFDDKGRHKAGGCLWRARSAEAENAQAALAEAHRVLAERRKTEHGELLNKLMAKGRHLRYEAQSYAAWQKCFPRSDRDRAPGAFVEQARRKAESAGDRPYEYSTRTTALSQSCICGERKKKPLSERRHVCACGVDADRDLFSAFLGRHVRPVDGVDLLDLVGAQGAYGPRRQDIASKPGVEQTGLVLGKPRVTRRHPPGRRSRVRITKRLGRNAQRQSSDGVVRPKPKTATTHGDTVSLVPQGTHTALSSVPGEQAQQSLTANLAQARGETALCKAGITAL
jgi:putative transposase